MSAQPDHIGEQRQCADGSLRSTVRCGRRFAAVQEAAENVDDVEACFESITD